MRPELRALIHHTVKNTDGWCHLDKAEALAEIILCFRPRVVVEIGVFAGSSLFPQALALKEVGQGIIHGIDPWSNDACLEGSNSKANDEWWGNLDLRAIEQGCRQKVLDMGVQDHVRLHKARSVEAAATFAEPIDLLSIDGNHSEQTSCQDVDLWVPKVRPGGWVLFDDCNWVETQKAYAMMRERLHLIANVERGGQAWAIFCKGEA